MKSYGDAYPSAEAVALKAQNLEKFVGADKAGRGVIVPKPDASPEDWSAFYRKVGGVPDKVDGYKLPTTIKPEVVTALSADPLMASFKEHALKTGLPPSFYESVMGWYGEQVVAAEGKQQAIWDQRAEKDILDLKTQWAGPEYDKNIELGRRAANQFIPHENRDDLEQKISRIEGALGTKGTLELWASIGTALGESEFIDGEGNGGNNALTVEGAKVRINALKADVTWQAKFAAGDAAARLEWDNLHKVAYSK